MRAARAEYELYAGGQDLASLLAYNRAEALSSKLREQVDAEVAEPSEESIEQAYSEHVESDEASYADDPGSFESAMTGDTLVTWMPEGYRTVKHILVIPDDSVLTPYTQAKSELDSLQSEARFPQRTAPRGHGRRSRRGRRRCRSRGAAGADRRAGSRHRRRAGGIGAAGRGLFRRRAGYARRDPGALDAGEDFQTLIDEYGEDPGMQNEPTASRGYYVSADSTAWDTAFRDAAMLLSNVGDVSEPTLGMSGIHIIRYESDVTPGPVPLDDVRDQLYDEALTTAREENYADLVSEWVAALDPVYHYDNWEPFA